MRRWPIHPTLVLLALALTVPVTPAAAWLPDGIPVCTAPGSQGPLQGLPVTYDVITASYPGLVLGWEDRRGTQTLQSDLYVRFLTADSAPTSDGTPLCVAPGDQTELALAFGWWNGCGPQHGCGLVVGAWSDTRDAGAADIFADRAFSSWAAGGVPVCRMPTSQQTPAITISTDAGGDASECVIVWEDQRAGIGDIYAQRLDANGNRMWDSSGVAVCTAAWDQNLPQVVALEDGAVLIAWKDHRAFPTPASLRLARLERDGTPSPAWPTDGLEVVTVGQVQSFRLLPGGYLVWSDGELATGNGRVRATRVLPTGSFAAGWGSTGVAVTPTTGELGLRDAVPAPDGGLLVSWGEITRSITHTPYITLRVGKLGLDGAPVAGWGPLGVQTAFAIGWMEGGTLAAHEDGGCFVTWSQPNSSDGGLYLERLTGTGAVASGWPTDGVLVCGAPGAPTNPVIGTASGGVLLGWLDPRNDPADVYAQYVTNTGVAGPAAAEMAPVAAVRLGVPRPNPAHGPVALALELPRGGFTTARVLDLNGRHVRTLARGTFAAGRHTLDWDGRDERNAAAPPGIYLVQVVSPDGEARARLVRLR